MPRPFRPAALRPLVRVLLFAGPLLVWMTIALGAATSMGNYEASWDLLKRGLHALAPEYRFIGDFGVNLYQLNDIFRKLAHVTVYALLTALTLRLCQGGRPRLRRRSLPIATLVPLLFMSAEAWVRRSMPDRHVRPEQLAWNLTGVGLTVLGAALYFALKALERWTLADDGASPLQSPSDPPSTVEENHPL